MLINIMQDDKGVMRIAKDVGRLRGLELLNIKFSPSKGENTQAFIYSCPLMEECNNKLYDKSVQDEYKLDMDEKYLPGQ